LHSKIYRNAKIESSLYFVGDRIEQLILEQIQRLPESLQQEALQYIEDLVAKHTQQELTHGIVDRRTIDLDEDIPASQLKGNPRRQISWRKFGLLGIFVAIGIGILIAKNANLAPTVNPKESRGDSCLTDNQQSAA
jgi:hypothetical protein